MILLVVSASVGVAVGDAAEAFRPFVFVLVHIVSRGDDTFEKTASQLLSF